LHPLHLFDSLSSRVSLELHSLEFSQQVQMFLTELRVQLGKRLVLGLPDIDLLY
jgi:hypothetical protein